MITDGLSYVSVLVFFASVVLAAERVTGWAVFRFVPGVVFIYIGSMLLATLGVWSMAATKPVYRELSTLLTYAMIFTMLLRSDVRRSFASGRACSSASSLRPSRSPPGSSSPSSP